jgi:hypothetical protein
VFGLRPDRDGNGTPDQPLDRHALGGRDLLFLEVDAPEQIAEQREADEVERERNDRRPAQAPRERFHAETAARASPPTGTEPEAS